MNGLHRLLVKLTWWQIWVLFEWYKRIMRKGKKHYDPSMGNWLKQLPIFLRVEAILFLLYDWFVNWTSISIKFKQWPYEFNEVVTVRMKRWRREYPAFVRNGGTLNDIEKQRLGFAETICDEYLDQYDPTGDHC